MEKGFVENKINKIEVTVKVIFTLIGLLILAIGITGMVGMFMPNYTIGDWHSFKLAYENIEGFYQVTTNVFLFEIVLSLWFTLTLWGLSVTFRPWLPKNKK